VDEPADDLRFVEASAALQARGLMGWAFGAVDGHRVDGLRLSRGSDGRYVGEFPSDPDGGAGHDREPDEFAAMVFEELLRRGLLP
jgi:hypothetical protein